MNEITAIGAIGAADPSAIATPANDIQPLGQIGPNALDGATRVDGDFSNLLVDGLAKMDAKVANADRLVAQFAIDDSVPIHQVTVALEEARLSVELAMQVRARFVEGYRELMNMQI